MGILDAIKNLTDKAVGNVKEAVDDVQEAYNEAGGMSGIVDKAKTEMTELGSELSEVAGKAVDTVKTSAAEVAESAKSTYNEAGGVSGLIDKAKTGVTELADSAKDAAGQIINKVKGEDGEPKA
ncbi:hypothetical protein [Hydromonas duriensis]|uniref:Uncharacterized protein n=1 Tax=Hydromonas duriensis TaxID=1527608 RepID=A0A4R6YAY7_9BURK|nr:hypothetical protein [Hydromonas duriensis]TDR32784.1 hypothetical protein DFR44_10280 [Hydromonas duriensis]